MTTAIHGQFLSDLGVGEKEDVSEDLLELVPSQTPFLNSVGVDSSGQAKSPIHYYYDDAYIPLATTLDGAHTAGATTLTIDKNIARNGARIQINGEVIQLGTWNGNAYVGCTRSVGTPAAAAHADGDQVVLVDTPAPEGAAAGDGTKAEEPRQNTAYVEEFEEIIDISSMANRQIFHGRTGNAYDRQGRQKMANIKLLYEQAHIWGVGRAATGSGGVEGKMGGFIEAVIGTNHENRGGADFTEASLRDIVEDIASYYDYGVDQNAVMLVPLRQCFVFNGWQQAHIELPPSDPMVQTYGVHVKRLEIGPMIFDVIPYQRMANYAAIYQPGYIKPMEYYPTEHEKLAKDGRRERGMITGARTCEFSCPEAHYVVSNLATS